MDPIETGPGEVERDAAELASEVREPRNGSLRAVVRRIEALRTLIDGVGDSLRGRIARGEDRIAELEKGEEHLAAKLLGHDAAIRGLVERADGLAAGRRKDLDAADRATAGIHQRIDALGSRTEGIPQLRREVVELGAEVLRIADELRARIGGLELEVFPVLRGGEVRDIGGGSHRFPAFVRYTPEPGLVTPGLTSERVYRVLGRDTRFLRLEGDDGKPVEIAPRFLVAVPGPASTADLDQRDRQPIPLSAVRCTCGDATRPGIHRFGGAPCYREGVPPDFLSPPPLARAIGKAVAEHANRHTFETIQKAAAEAKAEAADLLKCRLATVRRCIEEGSRAVDVVRYLDVAIEEAKLAGVIP